MPNKNHGRIGEKEVCMDCNMEIIVALKPGGKNFQTGEEYKAYPRWETVGTTGQGIGSAHYKSKTSGGGCNTYLPNKPNGPSPNPEPKPQMTKPQMLACLPYLENLRAMLTETLTCLNTDIAEIKRKLSSESFKQASAMLDDDDGELHLE